jgi:hypothetical protein
MTARVRNAARRITIDMTSVKPFDTFGAMAVGAPCPQLENAMGRDAIHRTEGGTSRPTDECSGSI